MIVVTLFLVTFTVFFLTAFVVSCRVHLLKSLLFFVPLLIILPAALPRYLHFLSFVRHHKPAIILSPEGLTDHINKSTYKWTEIREISYRSNTGKNIGGHTALMFHSGRLVELPHNIIQGSKTTFIQTLQSYHREFQTGTSSVP